MLSRVVKGDYSQLGNDKSDLNMMMNIYDVVTKSETGFDSLISDLNSKKADKSSQAHSVKDTIKATKTGYFVSAVDGYESELTLDKIDSLTEHRLNEIIKSTPQKPANTVGKIFDSYSCKIAGVMQADKRVAEGAYLKLALSASKNSYDVRVESVKNCDDGKILVVMSCDRLDDELARTRVASSMIVFDEYTGIRVPRKAIRFSGEQKGVYVILGKDITFKKIDVIYEGDDFVLSKNTDEQDYLLLFDQILLENVQSSDVSQSEPSSSSEDSEDSSQSKGEDDSGSSSK
jgi:transcriptional antiterminator Rof (Rho-off)